MHDDVVTLLDHHLRHLEALRRQICATRQVGRGERGAALAESVAASRRFAATAESLLAQLGEVTHQRPAALMLDDPDAAGYTSAVLGRV